MRSLDFGLGLAALGLALGQGLAIQGLGLELET